MSRIPFIPDLLPLDSLNWKNLIPYLSSANRSIAKYEGILSALPNPTVMLSPLTTNEALLSSRIEGTQATLSEVFLFESGDEIDKPEKRNDIQEIINYRTALKTAEVQIKDRPFNLNLVLELHGILLNSVRGKSKSPGRIRTDQNWIGEFGSSIENAYFIPPEPNVMKQSLYNWETYYHVDDLDPLVQLAILHGQFEILHPFKDGNGRIGRLIIPLFLFEKKILSRPMFYMSAYFDEFREEYIYNLRNIGVVEDSWTKWTIFFLKAIKNQADANWEKSQNILNLYNRLKSQIIDLTNSHYSIPLLDVCFDKPIFASSELDNKSGMPSRQTIRSLLNELINAEILKVIREPSGRRPQILVLKELFNLCEGKDIF